MSGNDRTLGNACRNLGLFSPLRLWSKLGEWILVSLPQPGRCAVLAGSDYRVPLSIALFHLLVSANAIWRVVSQVPSRTLTRSSRRTISCLLNSTPLGVGTARILHQSTRRLLEP